MELAIGRAAAKGDRDLHVRARTVRSRAAIRAWEYRQRARSKGVCFRLRLQVALDVEFLATACVALTQAHSHGVGIRKPHPIAGGSLLMPVLRARPGWLALRGGRMVQQLAKALFEWQIPELKDPQLP